MNFDWLRTARGWSRIIGAVSVAPLAFGGYVTWKVSAESSAREARGEFVCGTGFVALLVGLLALAGLISAIALATGAIGYFRSAAPRQRLQLLEVAAVGAIALALLLLGAIAMVLKAFQ